MAISMDPFDCARRGDVNFFKEVALDVLEKSRDDTGSSVLTVAAFEAGVECCREIYKRSPSLLYHVNFNGYTALQTAAWKGRAEICEFLIYADCKTKNREGDIECGQSTADKKLLMMQTIDGSTALHLAVAKKHLETVEVLIKADPSHELLRTVNRFKMTALHVAVDGQSLETVKLLVEEDPDFHYLVDLNGKTPLLMAITMAFARGDENSVKIRKLMIEKQASQVKQRIGDTGRTLIHFAAAKGDLSAIEDIIQFSPNCLELVDNDGRNFLHLAAIDGHVKIVKHILQIKDVSAQILNGQDNYGDTPLHIAAEKGNRSTALCLLYDSRVNKMIKNGKGHTAVDLITFDYDKDRAQVFGVRDAVNEEQLKDQSDFDLVVCTLIATVSFTAGITVPGGYITEGPNQGMAVLIKQTTFEAFVIANTCGLLLSLSAVFSHFCTRRLHKRKDIDFQVTLATFCTLGAIFSMVVAFITGSYAVLAISTWLAVTVCVLSCSFFVVAFYAMWMMAVQDKKLPSGTTSTNEPSSNL